MANLFWLFVVIQSGMMVAGVPLPYFLSSQFNETDVPLLNETPSPHCSAWFDEQLWRTTAITLAATNAAPLTEAFGAPAPTWRNGLAWCCTDVCTGLIAEKDEEFIEKIQLDVQLASAGGCTSEDLDLLCICETSTRGTKMIRAYRRISQCLTDYKDYCVNGMGYSYYQCMANKHHTMDEIAGTNNYLRNVPETFLPDAASEECKAHMANEIAAGGITFSQHAYANPFNDLAQNESVWKNGAYWCCLERCRRGTTAENPMKGAILLTAPTAAATTADETELECRCNYADTNIYTYPYTFQRWDRCVTDYHKFCVDGDGINRGCEVPVIAPTTPAPTPAPTPDPEICFSRCYMPWPLYMAVGFDDICFYSTLTRLYSAGQFNEWYETMGYCRGYKHQYVTSSYDMVDSEGFVGHPATIADKEQMMALWRSFTKGFTNHLEEVQYLIVGAQNNGTSWNWMWMNGGVNGDIDTVIDAELWADGQPAAGNGTVQCAAVGELGLTVVPCDTQGVGVCRYYDDLPTTPP